MSLRSNMVAIVCSHRNRVPGILALLVFSTVLLVLPLIGLEPGTAAHTIALVDFSLVMLGFLIFGSIYLYCPAGEFSTD